MGVGVGMGVEVSVGVGGDEQATNAMSTIATNISLTLKLESITACWPKSERGDLSSQRQDTLHRSGALA